MDRTPRLKINKETQSLNDTIDQIDLICIYRTFHLKAEEYTFFSTVHGTFFRVDYILDHNSNLSKFKKSEMESSIFSDHNAMRLESTTEREWLVGSLDLVCWVHSVLVPLLILELTVFPAIPCSQETQFISPSKWAQTSPECSMQPHLTQLSGHSTTPPKGLQSLWAMISIVPMITQYHQWRKASLKLTFR